MNLNNDIIEYTNNKGNEILKFKEKFFNSKSKDELIDIGGEVVETLNTVVKDMNSFIINGNIEESEDINNFKNQTTLFKEYFINFLDGMLNDNKYVTNKYIRYINVFFDTWLSEIQRIF